jgi:hypothetical protein
MGKSPAQTALEDMKNLELITYLALEGYQNLRILDGGIIGTIDMITTRALVIDLDRYGYYKRYCYQDRGRADEACYALENIDDEPLAGYSAIKPDHFDPKKNPNLNKEQKQ